MSLLSQIVRYRELQQIASNGGTLGIREVLAMEALGASLRSRSRVQVVECIKATLSTVKVEHAVRVKRIGPKSVVCTGCPGALPSLSFGLRMDDETEQQSYLFRVVVSWIQHLSADECEVGLEFIGSPVVLRRRRAKSSSPDAVLELENKLAA